MEQVEPIYNTDIMTAIVEEALSKPQAAWTAEERACVSMKHNFDNFSDRIHGAHAEEQLNSSCNVCVHIPPEASSTPNGNSVRVDLRRHIMSMHRGSTTSFKTANVTTVKVTSMSNNLDQPLLMIETEGQNKATFQTAGVVGMPAGHQGGKVNTCVLVIPPKSALSGGMNAPIALAIDKPSEECMQRYRDIDFEKVDAGFTELRTDPRNPKAAVAHTYVSQYTDGEDPFLSLVFLNADKLTTRLSGTYVGSTEDSESLVAIQLSEVDKNLMLKEMQNRISNPLGRTVVQLSETGACTGPSMNFTVTPMSRDASESIKQGQSRNLLPEGADVFVGFHVEYTLYT